MAGACEGLDERLPHVATEHAALEMLLEELATEAERLVALAHERELEAWDGDRAEKGLVDLWDLSGIHFSTEELMWLQIKESGVAPQHAFNHWQQHEAAHADLLAQMQDARKQWVQALDPQALASNVQQLHDAFSAHVKELDEKDFHGASHSCLNGKTLERGEREALQGLGAGQGADPALLAIYRESTAPCTCAGW
jgi:hypothetical protein